MGSYVHISERFHVNSFYWLLRVACQLGIAYTQDVA